MVGCIDLNGMVICVEVMCKCVFDIVGLLLNVWG